MADDHDSLHDEEDSTYKTPAPKTMEEIIKTDAEDESLRKYKEALLGQAAQAPIIVDDKDSRKVIVKSLSLTVEGRPDVTLDLSGDISRLKKQSFVIKEGVQYKVRINFFVQREIVQGLKYVQKTYTKGIQVDKTTYMVGSYAPKLEIQSYTTPVEDAPTGMIARGSYTIKSLFTDDDKNQHLKWEWSFDIKKDWE